MSANEPIRKIRSKQPGNVCVVTQTAEDTEWPPTVVPGWFGDEAFGWAKGRADTRAKAGKAVPIRRYLPAGALVFGAISTLIFGAQQVTGYDLAAGYVTFIVLTVLVLLTWVILENSPTTVLSPQRTSDRNRA